jgi:hypothetical protein
VEEKKEERGNKKAAKPVKSVKTKKASKPAKTSVVKKRNKRL